MYLYILIPLVIKISLFSGSDLAMASKYDYAWLYCFNCNNSFANDKIH